MPKLNRFCRGKTIGSPTREASRIAKENKADWHVDRADIGVRFCFEDAKAKEAFALTCENFGISRRDG